MKQWLKQVWFARWLVREFRPPQSVQTIERTELWERLKACSDKDVLDGLHEFGQMLVAEAQARTALLDSKATSLLGWNAAASAVFFAALPRVEAVTGARWLLVAGAILSAVGAVFAFVALRVQEFQVPSQLDWFDEKSMTDAARLRRAQVWHLRNWHTADSETIIRKAYLTKLGQWPLVVASVLLVLALIWSVLPD